MIGSEREFDRDEQTTYLGEVSDEALEAAACGPHQAFTIAMCTGNVECPFAPSE